ncbi:MAG TPA: DMT family transporter [Oscillospiraceae bacterium]|nr:DMT family transporter [Oscillospiraceae bacterium]HRW57335.1 DMT family transporter [Oscillospiraceae bacterium]
MLNKPDFQGSRWFGHLCAGTAMFFWNTSYLSVKMLLEDFTPMELSFFRFLLAYPLLWLIAPRGIPFRSWKKELPLMGLGITGVTAYYFFQNTALTLTTVSNVGVLMSICGLMIAVLNRVFYKERTFTPTFVTGCLMAVAGAAIVTVETSGAMDFRPTGDLMALGGALSWALYSVLNRKVGAEGYPEIALIRRTFFWGIVFMLPILPFTEFRIGAERFLRPETLLCFVHLSLFCSLFCYILWNIAVRNLGILTSGLYIYSGPAMAVMISVIILHEPMTAFSAAGILLILVGSLLAGKKKSEEEPVSP